VCTQVRTLRLRGTGQAHVDPYVGRGRYTSLPGPPPAPRDWKEENHMRFRKPVSERDVAEIYGQGLVDRRKELGVIPAQAWVGCAAYLAKHGKSISMSKHCQPAKERYYKQKKAPKDFGLSFT
jgi:hypothetical protein